nr:MAG TPA: hypothetical protein [Caudoviricetes sp.]
MRRGPGWIAGGLGCPTVRLSDFFGGVFAGGGVLCPTVRLLRLTLYPSQALILSIIDRTTG